MVFRSILLFLLTLLLSGCKIDRDKKVDREKFQFKIGADANLFFRNVRQIYYDVKAPMENGKRIVLMKRILAPGNLAYRPLLSFIGSKMKPTC